MCYFASERKNHLQNCQQVCQQTGSFSEVLRTSGLEKEISARYGVESVKTFDESDSLNGKMLEYCTKALGICGLSLTSTISNLDQSIAKNIRIFPKDYLCCTSIVSKMLCFERQICLDMDKKAANLLETGQFDNSLRLRKVCLEKLRILQRKMIFASELEPMITKQMLILNVFSPTFAYGQNLINEKWTSEDNCHYDGHLWAVWEYLFESILQRAFQSHVLVAEFFCKY
jgi:hypothetical protein